jgi:hypothetical protein
MPDGFSIDGLFAKGEPVARKLYDRLMEAVSAFGQVEAQVKKTSVHLCRGAAFAGVHPRKAGVMLTIRTGAPIESPRVRRCERVSARRFHNDLLLERIDEIDAELIGWLRAGYDLGASDH